jgi:hypothetical protein
MEVFSFRFFDHIRNRWVVARHKLSKDALAVRYDRYEIIGEAEVRQPVNDGHFNPAQKPSSLCRLCEIVREQPLMKPMRLVHPETGNLMLFDVRSEAVCPTCGARYRRTMNVIALVDAPTA